MPRNRSEKIVTGDDEVDAALRAYSEYMKYDRVAGWAEQSVLTRWYEKYRALSGVQQMLHVQHQRNILKELKYVQR